MTKICHVSSVHPSKDIRIFYKECKSLAIAGYDVSLVVRGESFEEDGVRVFGIENMPKGRIKRILFGAKKAYKRALQVDAELYHLHDPELLPYAIKFKKQGKKVIFDSHEFYRIQIAEKKIINRMISKAIAALYGFYEDYVLNKIYGVIFPCTKQGKHPFAGKCKNVAIVNNTPRLEELYDKFNPGIEKKENALCYIGSLTRSRGVTNAVKVAYETNTTLFLGGTFHPKEYELKIKEMEEFKNVNYLGQLDREGVLLTLQQSRIGMANILNEGQYNQFDNLATKVYEYMALGLPVILTRSPYNEKVMNQYKFGICVDPENIKEISDAVRFILDSKEIAKQMGKNGRAAIKEVFNWNVDCENLLNLYRTIMA